MRASSFVACVTLLSASLVACNALTGLDDYRFDRDAATGRSGAGGADAGGGEGGAAGNGGEGGAAGNGGEGGEGGAAGSAGGGGGAPSGGAGGSGGDGGNAGKGGKNGKGGNGATSGAAGTAGTSGAGGGGAAGTSGVAGAAGSSGAGNGGAAGEAPTCQATPTKTCNGKSLQSCPAGVPLFQTCGQRESCDATLGCVKPTQIFAGRRHACAIMADSTAVCWGANEAGQLGRKTVTAANGELPGRVLTSAGTDTPLRNVRQLALGDTFTCALVSDDVSEPAVLCWGADNLGQLGDGQAVTPRTAPNPTTPVRMNSRRPLVTPGVTTLSAAGATACVVTTLATVWCWGDGSSRQLGTMDTWLGEPVKIDVENATTVAVGGAHVCAVVDTNVSPKVACWGDRSSGQLGDGMVSTTPEPKPQPVSAAGNSLVLAASITSSLSASGDDLGIGTPVRSGTTCLNRDGKLFCWGKSSLGQLGNGSFVEDNSARAVALAEVEGSPLATATITQVSVGGGHVCAREGTDKTYCWGMNGNGQLGIPKPPGRIAIPTAVGLGGTAIAAGGYLFGEADTSPPTGITLASKGYSCALQNNGGVVCFGSNDARQRGVPASVSDGTTITMP